MKSSHGSHGKFPSAAGEDAHSVNFSAILALPGRRALYMVALLRGDPERPGHHRALEI